MPMMNLYQQILSAVRTAETNAAAAYEYSSVETELSGLRAAVESAIRKDEAEASGFQMELDRLGRHTINYFQERARFERECNALKVQAREAVGKVEQFTKANVGRHATVPARLERDARVWEGSARRVMSLRDNVARLEGVPGWSGRAKQQYAAATLVQKNAMSELHGVLGAAQAGAQVGALLNRAIFYVVGKAIRLGAGRINSASGGGGNVYFVRTAQARNECYNIMSEIASAITGQVTAGSTQNLNSELNSTLSMPNLLQVGSWPTGTQGVGTAPADTSDTVSTDVDDTDLGAGGGPGSCVPGVDL